MSRARRIRPVLAASLVGILALWLHLSLPLLRCVDSCFVDYFEVHDDQTAHFEMPDTRLNSWILAWVHHALGTNPAGLFDANAFHPARNTLAGSEHMLGVALQLLPLRLFADGAVLLHQSALLLSFLLLGLNTFALVRWATGSIWAAFLAGAVTPFMPWRFSELGHLQLLSVQWLPLVWLLTARVLLEGRSRRDALWLGLVAGVQMLSSFYLAYLTLLSAGLLAATILVVRRPPLRSVARLAAAFAAPSAVVALTAIPYLSRFSAYRFAEASTTDFVGSPGLILALLAPPLALRADVGGILPVTYHVPLVVMGCAVLALGWRLGPREAPGSPRPVGVVSAGLALAMAAAFVLMLGRKLQVGDGAIPLPGQWLAQLVPGFSQMRAEFRWGIVIGVACPVLAGSGIAWLEQRIAGTESASLRWWAKGAARVATAALFAVNVAWFRLPARGAWDDAQDVLNAHRAVAALEPGAILEIPWRVHRISTATNGSRYMLGSSLHWRPILNGYTAYVPPSYHFLQRLAQSLPDPAAVEKLQRLADVRWIVLHPERLGHQQRRLWSEAERSGSLRVAVARPDFRIYELPAHPAGGSWTPALLADEPGPTTMTGLPRDPLPPSERPGRLQVDVRRQMRFEHGSGLPYFATVSISHPGDRPWPGLDIRGEGLVQLRYRFYGAGGELAREATGSFDSDLPPRRTTTAQVLVRPPAETGRFRVRFDVVQRVGGELRDLGFRAVETSVEVSERPMLHGSGARSPGGQDMPRSDR